MRFLLTYFKPRRGRLILVFSFAVLSSTLFTIVGPEAHGQRRPPSSSTGSWPIHVGLPAQAHAVDGLQLHRRHRVLLLVALPVSTLFSYLQQYIMAGVAQNTVYDMRKDVNAKLARLPLPTSTAETHGEIMSRVTNDMDNIAGTLQQSLGQVITRCRHHPRGHRADAHHQSPAHRYHPRGAPAELPHDEGHRAPLPEVLRRPVEAHRGAQRARRGDVQRSCHREGLRSRAEIDREVQRCEREGVRGELAGPVRLRRSSSR